MLRLSSLRFLGLGPCHMSMSIPKSQNQTYRIKSTNMTIVPMNAKAQRPFVWINEVKNISIPEIEKSQKVSFQK